jgi:hypothetical protein
LSLGWYPVAHVSSGAAANIGLVGDFEQSVGAKSKDERGVEHSTSMQAFSVGLRGRLPLGEHENTRPVSPHATADTRST